MRRIGNYTVGFDHSIINRLELEFCDLKFFWNYGFGYYLLSDPI